MCNKVNTVEELLGLWSDPDTDHILIKGGGSFSLKGNPASDHLTVTVAGTFHLSVSGATDTPFTVQAKGQSILDVWKSPRATVEYLEDSRGTVNGAYRVLASDRSCPTIDKTSFLDALDESVVHIEDVKKVVARGDSVVRILEPYGQQVIAFGGSSVHALDGSDAVIRLYGQSYAETHRGCDSVRILAYDESSSVVASGSVWATDDATVSVTSSSSFVRGSGAARIRLYPTAENANVNTIGQSFVSRVGLHQRDFHRVSDWSDVVGAAFNQRTAVLTGYVAADKNGLAKSNSEVDMGELLPFLSLDEDTRHVSVFAHAVDAFRDPDNTVYRVYVNACDVETIRDDYVWVSYMTVAEKIEL